MNVLGIEQYEINVWMERLGSPPVERLAHADLGEMYDLNTGHVFRLQSGQFAFILERGCSCYTVEDAEIELFPTAYSALAKYRAWYAENQKEQFDETT